MRLKPLIILLLIFAAIFAGKRWFDHSRIMSVSAASCANHFIQHHFSLLKYSQRFPEAVLPEGTDFRKAMKSFFKDTGMGHPQDWYEGGASACPESYYFNNKDVGYLYVGGGLELGKAIKNGWPVIMCPAESHQGEIKRQHCHLMCRPDEPGCFCVKTNREMIDLLEICVQKIEAGEFPHSPAALKIIKEQIAKRKEFERQRSE